MLYTLAMINKEKLKKQQITILKALANKIDDFYLCGGTALSLFYFNHRESEDLDFFTQTFSFDRVQAIVNDLKKDLKCSIELKAENISEKQKTKIMIFNVFQGEDAIKVDFVQDVLPVIGTFKREYDGNILSLEDIYVRKIYAASGLRMGMDDTGALQFAGGRQEAKDLFDLYYLSTKFLRLSEFVNTYCGQALKEGIIRWFRQFDRMQMKIGLSEIRTDQKIEFRNIDRHFDDEIKKILLREIGEV